LSEAPKKPNCFELVSKKQKIPAINITIKKIKMKIKILSLITMLIVLGSAPKTFANNNATLLKETAAISKIEVRGNVELYISDATSDQIKVYNKYYSESALVQSKNGVLRIASYTNEKLIVWVSSSDLRSVSAYDNSVVKSFGHLSKIEFNIDLHNQAEANLNLDAYAATLSVKDNAKVSLNGSTQDLSLNYDNQSNVRRNAFVVTSLYEARPVVTAAVESNNVLSM
jgi:hypothetical protein